MIRLPYGIKSDGTPVKAFSLSAGGLSVTVLDMGGTITAITVPGPDGRNSVVCIRTPGCADGTSQACRRNAPCSTVCGPASGALRGTKGTLKNKMTKATAVAVIRTPQNSQKRDRIRANSSSAAMDSHIIVPPHPHQGGQTTILLMEESRMGSISTHEQHGPHRDSSCTRG